MSLRYRRNYLARREGDAGDGRPTLEQLLKDPLDATQLELRVSVARKTGQAEVLQVNVNVDLHNVEFKHENMTAIGRDRPRVPCGGNGRDDFQNPAD